jgi:hypothetical protein
MTSARCAPGIAVAADIDDEGGADRVHVELVGAEQEQHVDLLRLAGHHLAAGVLAALARHEAEIEAADARGGGVEHGKAVPASGTPPTSPASFAAER